MEINIANNFTILANNTTINGALYLSGVNVLSSIDNINKCIGPSNSALNITGTTNITFNAGEVDIGTTVVAAGAADEGARADSA